MFLELKKKKGFLMTKKPNLFFICLKNMKKIFKEENSIHKINLCNMN